MEFQNIFQYTKDLNILYVEDEPEILRHTTDLLNDFFENVDTASCGEEALNIYKEYNNKTNKFYDIVLTDIKMPNKNGIELTSDIIKLNDEQVVIAISSHNESDILIDLINKGISYFVMKPIAPEQLIKVLYKASKAIYNHKDRLSLLIDKKINHEKKQALKNKILSMESMINNISHQWKQPLSVISTASTGLIFQSEHNMINDDLLIETSKKINDQAQFLSQIIDDFQYMLKSRTDVKDISLSTLKEYILLNYKSELSVNNITIEFLILNNITIKTDLNLLLKAISNIINNSIEILSKKEEKSYILLTLDKKKDEIEIKIADNGGGIKYDMIDNVFDIYSTTKHQYTQTGIGLYVTYNIIVNSLDGDIEVNNIESKYKDELFKGCEFTLTLPTNIKNNDE